MEAINKSVLKVPRYVRFAIIALAAIFVNLLLAVALMWFIYPEWSKRTKVIITVAVVALVAYTMISAPVIGS